MTRLTSITVSELCDRLDSAEGVVRTCRCQIRSFAVKVAADKLSTCWLSGDQREVAYWSGELSLAIGRALRA